MTGGNQRGLGFDAQHIKLKNDGTGERNASSANHSDGSHPPPGYAPSRRSGRSSGWPSSEARTFPGLGPVVYRGFVRLYSSGGCAGLWRGNFHRRTGLPVSAHPANADGTPNRMGRRVAVRGLYRNQPNIAPTGLTNSASQAKADAAALGFQLHCYLDSMDGAEGQAQAGHDAGSAWHYTCHISMILKPVRWLIWRFSLAIVDRESARMLEEKVSRYPQAAPWRRLRRNSRNSREALRQRHRTFGRK